MVEPRLLSVEIEGGLTIPELEFEWWVGGIQHRHIEAQNKEAR